MPAPTCAEGTERMLSRVARFRIETLPPAAFRDQMVPDARLAQFHEKSARLSSSRHQLDVGLRFHGDAGLSAAPDF